MGLRRTVTLGCPDCGGACKGRTLGDSTYTIPLNLNGQLNFTGLTPAQTAAENATISAILRQKGVLPPDTANPYGAGGSCDPAVIALLPPDQQAYATSLCAQGQAGYLIGTGVDSYNAAAVQAGLAALPSSADSIATSAAQPFVDAYNEIASVPTWVWLALLAAGLFVGIEVVKALK